MITSVSTPDRHVLRRTRLMVTIELALAISAVVLLVGALAYAVTVHQQRQTTNLMLRHALDHGKAGVQDPYSWLFTLRGATYRGAAGAPAEFPRRLSMLRVAADGEVIEEVVHADGDLYRVRTERHGDEVRQAIFNERYPQEAQRQLLTALLIAGLVGLVLAAAIGSFVVGRAMAPMVQLLERQRRFVADASHELRAPLTRLRTRSQLLLRRENSAPTGLSLELQRMVDGTRELGEVLDDLLRSVRLRTGAPEFELVDLPAMAAAMIAAEVPRLYERSLAAEVRAEPAHLYVAGVETSLRRMLSALIDNAIGHTPAGGRIAVGIRPAAEAGMVELVIADDGAGIDPEHRVAIFARSVYLTGGNGDRHGIGLALAKEIVESHGGTIHVAGEAHGGAQFIVRLPLASP